MSAALPDYLGILPDQLGQDTPVQFEVVGATMGDVAVHMAEAMLEMIRAVQAEGRDPTLIVPVGPVDQFPLLAEQINQQQCDCRSLTLINMDEYLTDDDRWIEEDHPLSFRGYMNRKFYDLIDPQFAPRPENRVFPDPAKPEQIVELAELRGGIDGCFGGIGINGHIAFNEPPEPGHEMTVEDFARLPTRVLDLSRETKAINSVTVGGEINIIPRRAVTVGMQEILASRQLRFYCNRPWQSAVVRRVLHGPITATCPASLLRTHADAALRVAEYVAAPPEIRLR